MEGKGSWRSVPTQRYPCYVDICSQGLQVCSNITQRCEDCSGYSQDCFSIYQHPNCTFSCMMTWKENEENQLDVRKTSEDGWRMAAIITWILLGICLLSLLFRKRKKLKNLASLFQQYVCKKRCSIPPRQNNPDGIEDSRSDGEEIEQSHSRNVKGRNKTINNGINPENTRNSQSISHPDTGSTNEASSLLNDAEARPTEQNRNDTYIEVPSPVRREKNSSNRKKTHVAVSHRQQDSLPRVSCESDDRESLHSTPNAEDNDLSDTNLKRSYGDNEHTDGDCDIISQVRNKKNTRDTGTHHQDRSQTPTRHGTRQRDAEQNNTCRKTVAPSRKHQIRNGRHFQDPNIAYQFLQNTDTLNRENDRRSHSLIRELPSNASSNSGPHAIMQHSFPLDSGYPLSTPDD